MGCRFSLRRQMLGTQESAAEEHSFSCGIKKLASNPIAYCQ